VLIITNSKRKREREREREREKMDDDIFYAGKLRCIP
jgi:hypothetical protein